jgi:hypothetical protein
LPIEKRLQTSTPVRMTGTSLLGLNDAPAVTSAHSKNSDDLYKTNWGMRVFMILIVLATASGLIFLQWRSGHPVQASQHAAPPQASSAGNSTNPTVPPTTGATETTVAGGSAGAPQAAQDTNQLKTVAKLENHTAAPAKTVTPQADLMRDGHAAAIKPPADLEQPVRQAESYLQGKGAPRSCDQALSILRSASDHGNPRAQIKLGALYATGNCVSTDKVSAYRYFSRAMRSQPNNTWLEQYRSSLWSNMNAGERKQAMEVER